MPRPEVRSTCITVVCVLIWDRLLDGETAESLAPAGTKGYKRDAKEG